MKEVVTDIIGGDDVLDAIHSGAKLLHDTVSVTMGPKGRNVLFKKLHMEPGLTHDGVTVAKLVSSSNPREQVAIEILRQAALKQDAMIGDGTTTVTVLAYAILDKAVEAIKAGANPMVLRRELDEAGKGIVAELEKHVDKEVDLKKLTAVSTVAAGDPIIGDEVAKVVHEAGPNTPVLLNFSDTDETYTEVINGIKIDGAPASPYLLEGNSEELTAPLVFVIDAKLRDRDDVLPLLRVMANVPETERRFMVVCKDISGDALAYLVTNKRRGFANIAVSRVPASISRTDVYLQDIAISTGATLIAPNTANNLREPKLEYAGLAEKVLVNPLETVIVNGRAIGEDLTAHINSLRVLLDDATSKPERKLMEDRLQFLEQKVISVYVGGRSSSDAEERHYRYEDAVGASKTALRGGVVPGGGTLLYSVGMADMSNKDTSASHIVSSALRQPLLTVLSNAGIDTDLAEFDTGVGIDVLHPELGVIDLAKAGILDPALSEIESVKTAVSVAGLLITSGAIIVDKEIGDEKNSSSL